MDRQCRSDRGRSVNGHISCQAVLTAILRKVSVRKFQLIAHSTTQKFFQSCAWIKIRWLCLGCGSESLAQACATQKPIFNSALATPTPQRAQFHRRKSSLLPRRKLHTRTDAKQKYKEHTHGLHQHRLLDNHSHVSSFSNHSRALRQNCPIQSLIAFPQFLCCSGDGQTSIPAQFRGFVLTNVVQLV